ncbi:MAG: peptidylprolyl isomerase [Gemmataceae bacterium]
MMSWFVRGSLVAAVVSVIGCGTKAPVAATAEDQIPTVTQPRTVEPPAPGPQRSTSSQQPQPRTPMSPQQPQVSSPTTRDALHRSFAEATRSGDDAPQDALRPPDVLYSGRPTFQILETVMKIWDDIRFVDSQGNKIHYTAQIHTDEGIIEVALFPEQAPNHVRNFVALARAGYYNGLLFERTRLEVTDEGKFESLEGGCPEGRGAAGMGSIGYWLKDEPTDAKVQSHEEGALGACREIGPDTAACRFYICLSKAPFLDGHLTLFGKVVKGLDTARKIYQKPIVKEDQDLVGRRPENPIVIRKITIQTSNK